MFCLLTESSNNALINDASSCAVKEVNFRLQRKTLQIGKNNKVISVQHFDIRILLPKLPTNDHSIRTQTRDTKRETPHN